MERKNAWKEYTEAENSELEKLNESYRKFLDAGKTERECVKQAVAMAEAAGYLDLKKVIEEGKQVKAGDKLYAVNMKKSLALFQIGKQPLEKGMAILGAHIDSPRLDIKQNPLWRYQKIPVVNAATCHSRCDCKKRRNIRRCVHW